MDCREVWASLADLSAECLASPQCTEELLAHLEKCPPCHDEWQRFEATMLVVSTTEQPLLSRVRSQAIWGACLEQIVEDTERRRSGAVARPAPLAGWFAQQPRWSWAALGGAIAVLGGVWMFAPHNDAPLSDSPADYQDVHVISFERPPAEAYPLIDRHAAMSFDGLNDRVGSTLVSITASEPMNDGSTAGTPAAPAAP